jgi:hypothetical protein
LPAAGPLEATGDSADQTSDWKPSSFWIYCLSLPLSALALSWANLRLVEKFTKK